MEIRLSNISKRYGYQTIIKKINLDIHSGSRIGITGRNGSGKSTLLKTISSYLSPSTGKMEYLSAGKSIKPKAASNQISFCAPYIKVTQEMSLRELFEFQSVFKPLKNKISYKDFLDIIELSDPKSKEIRFFSSGMQQKVGLGLGILSESKVLLLDEPTSYLDEHAKSWFTNLLGSSIDGRTLVIASNDAYDFELVDLKYKIENGTLTH